MTLILLPQLLTCTCEIITAAATTLSGHINEGGMFNVYFISAIGYHQGWAELHHILDLFKLGGYYNMVAP